MSSKNAYKFIDQVSGETITLYLPEFPEQFTNLSSNGYGSLASFDIAVDYTFDYVSTFFTVSRVQRLAFENWGLQNVYSCEELDGHTWVMADKPDRTIEFSESNALHLTFKIAGTTVGNWAATIGGQDASTLYALEKTGNYYGQCNFYMRDFDHVTTYNQVYPNQAWQTLPAHYEEFFDSPYVPDDPFSPGGGSEPGGGTGDFDGSSDTIPFPNDPPISATDTGFMTVFATNLAGVQSLAASLWSDLFDAIKPGGSLEGTVEALKNIVTSPYDAILGCSLLPFPVATSGSKNVKLYGVLPSSVSLPVAASQWKTIDCGTLNVHEFWGAYLDYAPYTKVTSMYLPYIGVVSIDVDMIMAKTIGVKYKCDIITGQCIAIITINGSCEFSYQGQCSVPIPITSIDWSSTVNAGLGLIGSVTGIVGSAVSGALGGGGPVGALAGGVKKAMGEAGAIAQNVMNSKPDIKSGGGVGGSAGQMGIQTPFLIIERPKQSLPSVRGSDGKKYAQNHWTGYPSNVAAKLKTLSGYTEVSRVFINRTSATAEEKREIEELLYGGVYL